MKETPFGIIPSKWKVDKIVNVTDVVTDYVANGSFKSLADNVQYEDHEDSTILIRLVDYNNDFQGNFVYVNDHAYEFLSKSKLFGGEIIISNVGANVGTVFRCPYLNKKMTLGPNSIVVKFKEDNDFYFYWLKSPAGQHMLHSIVTGSAQPKFNKTNFRDMLVPVPPKTEQVRIAAILSSLDAKIEENKKINKNLLEQAQAIYTKMFITDADSLWPEGKLSDLIEVCYGKDHKKLHDGDIPVYGSGGIMRHVDRALYEQESVLVPRKGTLNNVMYVNEPFWSVDTMFFTKMKRQNVAKFTFHFLKGKDLASMNAGSAVPSMTTKILNAIPLRIPDDQTLSTFEAQVSPFYQAASDNNKESENLAAIRDSLLPKLMSGEIDVSDIDL